MNPVRSSFNLWVLFSAFLPSPWLKMRRRPRWKASRYWLSGCCLSRKGNKLHIISLFSLPLISPNTIPTIRLTFHYICSRWVHVHPGRTGKPFTGRRVRGIVVQSRKHTEVLDLMVDVIQELGHLKKLVKPTPMQSVHYAGKPDTATSCPSGLEEAGRKRASVMRSRATLPSYTINSHGKANRYPHKNLLT